MIQGTPAHARFDFPNAIYLLYFTVIKLNKDIGVDRDLEILINLLINEQKNFV